MGPSLRGVQLLPFVAFSFFDAKLAEVAVAFAQLAGIVDPGLVALALLGLSERVTVVPSILRVQAR